MVSPLEMRRRCSALSPAFSSTMPKSICADAGSREKRGYVCNKLRHHGAQTRHRRGLSG